MSKSQGDTAYTPKVVKPSDTRWLSNDKCVSVVRNCFGATITTLESVYEESHEPEAYGISKIISKTFAIYLLDYVLPQIAKLSKCLQTEKLDLSIISSLVDAALPTQYDVLYTCS